MIAILRTDGEITPKEISKECRQEKWIPLASKDGKVILFNDQDTANSFIKRNIPKHHIRGSIRLTKTELDNIPNKLVLEFPNKMETEVYIHYLSSCPTLAAK